MQAPSPQVKAFFTEYEEGANTFDADLNVRERHSVWLAADPNGVAAVQNDANFPALVAKCHAELLKLGYMGATITSLQELPLDPVYSLVKTAWRQVYQKNSETIDVEITVDYIIRIEKTTITIVASIAHEDEAELLKIKGIVD